MSKPSYFKGLGSLKQNPVYTTAPRQELLAPKKETPKIRLSFSQAENMLATGTSTQDLRQQLAAEYPEWGKACELKEKMGAIAPPESVLNSNGEVLSVRELTNKSDQLMEVATLATNQLNTATTSQAAAAAASRLRKAREERKEIADWLRASSKYYQLEKELTNIVAGDGYKVAEKIARLCASYDSSLTSIEFDDAAVKARIEELIAAEAEEAAAKQAEEQAKKDAANAANTVTDTPTMMVNGQPVQGKSITVEAGSVVGFESAKPLTYTWSGPKGFSAKSSIVSLPSTGTYTCAVGGNTYKIKVIAPK